MIRPHAATRLGAILLLAALAPALCRAGTDQPASAQGTPETRQARAAARAITHAALMDFRLREEPVTSDARLDGILLSLARELDPGNAELVRLSLWMSDLAEDAAASDTLLRRLYELDPRDSFAQFRLISGRLRRMQSVDQRLAAYERFLGREGASLDPSVRSKLAFEAATLLRERGDEAGSVAKLKLATSLDPTNKDAAVAAYQFYRSRLDDPAGRAELLGNLLMADPLDAATHDTLARVLASGGAFEAAKRFQGSAQNMRERAGVAQESEGVVENLCIDWPIDGPTKVLTELNKALAVRKNDVRKMREFMEKALLPVAGIPLPEDVRLDPMLDRLRLLAATATRDTQTAQGAADDLIKTYNVALFALNNPPPGVVIDIEDPKAEARALRCERVVILSWAGLRAVWADRDLEKVALEPGEEEDDPDLLEARGWRLVRSADPARAIEVLRPLAEARPNSRLGLATALELTGNLDEAVAEYVGLIHSRPMTPEGVWAWYRVSELKARKDAEPDMAKRLRAFAATIPGWVDEASEDPARLMTLSTDLVETSLDPGEPAALKVRLTNASSVPLGVGPERTLDSRLLLSPSMSVGLDDVRQGVTPELLDMERRIRLMPRESLEVVCRPDSGLSGWMAETLSVDTVRTRWRVIQGFVRGAEGQIVPGPMCLSAGSQSLVRPALPETGLSGAQLAEKIASAPEENLNRLMIATRALLLSPAPKPSKPAPPSEGAGAAPAPASTPAPDADAFEARLSAADADLVVRAWAERFPRCSPATRRLLVAGLPHAGQAPAMLPFDQAARADTDPGVLCLFIVTRVTSVDDTVLSRAEGFDDARVADAAKVQRERLRARAPVYGALGPGLKGLRESASVPEPAPPEGGAAPGGDQGSAGPAK